MIITEIIPEPEVQVFTVKEMEIVQLLVPEQGQEVVIQETLQLPAQEEMVDLLLLKDLEPEVQLVRGIQVEQVEPIPDDLQEVRFEELVQVQMMGLQQ